MNNKRIGSNFEKDFAIKLNNLGYWATFLEGAAHTRLSTM